MKTKRTILALVLGLALTSVVRAADNAIMYEYAGDKNSSQFKAPFNRIKNEARVYTYEDTAVVTPNSTTTSVFAAFQLRRGSRPTEGKN
jgi:hypothetical protein